MTMESPVEQRFTDLTLQEGLLEIPKLVYFLAFTQTPGKQQSEETCVQHIADASRPGKLALSVLMPRGLPASDLCSRLPRFQGP